jgi:hypothetical protein
MKTLQDFLFLISVTLLLSACQPTTNETTNKPDNADPTIIDGRSDTGAVNPENSRFIFYEKDQLEQFLPRERIVFIMWDTLNDQPREWEGKASAKTPVRKADYRGPVFSRECLGGTRRDQDLCSYLKIEEYLTDQIQYPANAFQSDDEFIAYVSVLIDDQGRVQEPIRVEDMRGQRCAACVEEAQRLVRDMPDWEPARYQGQPSAARVSIPVYFRQPEG